MKKLFTTLLFTAAMTLGACSSKVYTGEESKKKLDKQEYKTVLMTESEAKLLVLGINFEDVNLKSAVHATKGEGDDHDLFLGFYFATNEEAEKFATKNDNENLNLMHTYGELQLGKNLELKIGYHNNVSYVGSETSFKVAL